MYSVFVLKVPRSLPVTLLETQAYFGIATVSPDVQLAAVG
jgi:hypothetical protein